MRVRLVLLTVVLSLVAVAACSALVARERARLLDARRRELDAEAARSTDVVRLWFHERIADADVLADSPVTERALVHTTAVDVAELRRVLGRMRTEYGYAEIFVVSTAAATVVASPDMGLPADVASIAARMREAPAPEVTLVDGDRHLAFAAPVRGAGAATAVLEMDPTERLFPLLRGLHGTETGETLLVHARAGKVVFVSPRRFGADVAFPRTLTADRRIAATAAAFGEVGTGEYLDYRGATVVAATRGVGQAGWGIVAKLDREEALAPLGSYARTASGLSALALLAATAAGAALLFRSRSRALNEELARQRAALALQRVEERNATVRRELEAQLVQAQKMEAVGRLAGGIAHDFNNLLTLVLVAADDLVTGIDSASPLHQDAVDLKQAAQRATELTRQLLTFSRKNVHRREVLDVNQALRGVLPLLQRAVREDIILALDLAEVAAWCSTDRAQLDQALLNLVVNARDAMPNGGRLELSTRVQRSAEAPSGVGLSCDRHVVLRVRDTGEGIAPEALDKIFDPFFTTKPQGKGTGLGLAMVYSFMTQSGGAVHVDSQIGKGTTFALFFPEADVRAAPSDAPREQQQVPKGGETILVVDDAAEVRTVAARVLRGAGFVVLEAASGAEALALYRQHGTQIAAVLTDVVMPEMGGRDLREALRAQSPELPVVFMSGYADDTALRADIDATRERFVAKPFAARDLVESMRRAIDEQARAPRA
ncbi:MAG: response regulator [Deltaproteobacteria bacterium]|nr:response regulator [Deltaproteobacteria bacterium]